MKKIIEFIIEAIIILTIIGIIPTILFIICSKFIQLFVVIGIIDFIIIGKEIING